MPHFSGESDNDRMLEREREAKCNEIKKDRSTRTICLTILLYFTSIFPFL